MMDDRENGSTEHGHGEGGEAQGTGGGHDNNGSGHDPKTVTILVNSAPQTLPKGKYLVARLKELTGVPADYELDQVVEGVFVHLDDTATIQLKNHDEFVGHVKTGGSS
jgi:hypothetical protein